MRQPGLVRHRRMKAITDTVQMIANLGQQQHETEQRFNTLLEEARADRQRAEQHKTEVDQRFGVFLAEARADWTEMWATREQPDRNRALNESEHWAFRHEATSLSFPRQIRRKLLK